MYDKIGKWQEAVRRNPPKTNIPPQEKGGLIQAIRMQAKQAKYTIKEGDECKVCAEDILEVLRKHHLIPVGMYPSRKDLNEHIVTLCENCHDVAHRLIYTDRGGISWQSVQKLKERGLWDALVAVDKMAAQALLGKGRE
jgi:hypothetical protein